MALQGKDGAEQGSDVTRKFTVYNGSCNTDCEDDMDLFPEDEAVETEDCQEDKSENVPRITFLDALKIYNDDKVQEFLDEDIDDDLMPMVLSADAQKAMIAGLADAIGEEAAARIVKKQADKLEWKRAQWKRERKLKRQKKIMKGVGIAVAVLFVFTGVGYVGGQVGAWSLPKIQYNTIDHDNYSDIVLESGNDVVRTEIEQVYELGMVLDGYELVDSIVTPDVIHAIYENDNGDLYTFMQRIDSLGFSINTENKKEELVDTLYGEACYYSLNDTECLFWNYQGYSFVIEGKVSKDQLLELQNHLKIKE